MRQHIRCGKLFTGLEAEERTDQTLIVDDEGRISHVGPTAQAPKPRRGEAAVDHGAHFVMPGLIDSHVHLSYGNAKTNEDMDLYASVEFRALRGLYMAGRVLAAGVTSMIDPGNSGRVTPAIRDAIEAGLFDGPRITTTGPYLTSRQGLTDWYPTWIGVPTTAISTLVRSTEEAIEAIRVQVKDGVDGIKIAMDGVQTDTRGRLVAAFTQQETAAMVTEAHRLGRFVIVHARGAEAVLYAARAGVDIIFHASYMDQAGLDAVLEHGSALCPTLTFLRNCAEFSQADEPAFRKGRAAANAREYDTACTTLRTAREAGAPFLVGTDSGFAVTPYGEWHARELGIFVEHLGFSPAEALQCATAGSTRFLRQRDTVGALTPGRWADLVVLDTSPLDDIGILLDRDRVQRVMLGGTTAEAAPRAYAERKVSEFSFRNWDNIYTRESVAAAAPPAKKRRLRAV